MASRIRIEITGGQRSGKIILFERSCMAVFGRAEDCYEQLASNDLRIGRHHLLLQIDPPGCRIADLASLNGTYVNDIRINSSDAKCRSGDFSVLDFTEIHDGDCVSVGQSVLEVRMEVSALCAECGAETGTWVRAKDMPPVVLCLTCSEQSASRPKARSEAAVNPVQPERCSRCNKPCPAPSPDEAEEEVLCEACRARAQKSRERVEALVTRCLAASPHSSGGKLEDYEVRRPLPQGQNGVSYFAIHRVRRKAVAIKLIRVGSVPDHALQRLLGWMDVLRGLQHPNLVQLLDFGFADGNLVLVTDYCDLGNLAHCAERRQGTIGLSDGIPIISDCIDALAFAHSSGVHHFNLKLENILLSAPETGQPRVRISDWGVSEELKQVYLSIYQHPDAELTLPLESPSAFMPPEIRSGAEWSPRGDVWSMGAVAFFILTGRHALPADRLGLGQKDRSAVDRKPLSIREVESRIPADLARVVDRALQFSPEGRFKSMQEMSQEMSVARRNLIRLTIAER